MSEQVQTRLVSHLGGIDVGYRLSSGAVDKSKATLVMFNPFTTNADYYLPEFKNKDLRDSLNLLAVEPLGHGRTRARNVEQFNYWDSAFMALQLLDTLGIDECFALGTSQGGWIAMRMAILAPARVCDSSFVFRCPFGLHGKCRSKVSSRWARLWTPSLPDPASSVAGTVQQHAPDWSHWPEISLPLQPTLNQEMLTTTS